MITYSGCKINSSKLVNGGLSFSQNITTQLATLRRHQAKEIVWTAINTTYSSKLRRDTIHPDLIICDFPQIHQTATEIIAWYRLSQDNFHIPSNLSFSIISTPKVLWNNLCRRHSHQIIHSYHKCWAVINVGSCKKISVLLELSSWISYSFVFHHCSGQGRRISSHVRLYVFNIHLMPVIIIITGLKS